ncbi:hypothetical protein HanRHA438_Chr03g0141311 [Helianthus annuus]|nr:hypothetical protein HanIR_Chr03g0141161 [Helianthus annuus]KAJ0937358.1 hypothetical protein HanRHA438_Chr03g0141311 [Helianthus annuus]
MNSTFHLRITHNLHHIHTTTNIQILIPNSHHNTNRFHILRPNTTSRNIPIPDRSIPVQQNRGTVIEHKPPKVPVVNCYFC